MRTTGQIGLKITSALREYYRYTGPSAALERRVAGNIAARVSTGVASPQPCCDPLSSKKPVNG